MSFITKSVKKLFKGVKKAWSKKWVRYVAIAAVALFATGAGSSGYEGFGNLVQQNGGGMGGFFAAVGQTMARGFSTIKTGFAKMWGGGTTSPYSTTDALGTTTDYSALTNTQYGWVAQMMSGGGGGTGAGAALSNPYTSAVANQGGKGLASSFIGALFGGGGDSGSMIRNAALTGISFAMQGKANEPPRQRASLTLYGGRFRGGDSAVPEDLIRRPKKAIAEQQADAMYAKNDDTKEAGYNKTSDTLKEPLLGGATNIRSLPGIGPLLGDAEMGVA